MTTDIRFWNKVDVRGVGDCWEWQASRLRSGYGTFWNGERVVRAHRYAYVIVNGKEPENCVLHTCDNPSCCNPRHLYDGTQSDNMRDRRDRGRENRRHGDLNGRSKLTRETVDAIRKMRADGVAPIEIRRQFGISRAQEWRIATGRAWV